MPYDSYRRKIQPSGIDFLADLDDLEPNVHLIGIPVAVEVAAERYRRWRGVRDARLRGLRRRACRNWAASDHPSQADRGGQFGGVR